MFSFLCWGLLLASQAGNCIETGFPSLNAASCCGTILGCRTQAMYHTFFRNCRPEGALSVITVLITEIRHLPQLI